MDFAGDESSEDEMGFEKRLGDGYTRQRSTAFAKSGFEMIEGRRDRKTALKQRSTVKPVNERRSAVIHKGKTVSK